jgi:hypothetical protein
MNTYATIAAALATLAELQTEQAARCAVVNARDSERAPKAERACLTARADELALRAHEMRALASNARAQALAAQQDLK